MFTKKQIILSIVICLLPIIPGLLLYGRMPESVPTHFDLSGEANGWSSRGFAVLALPLIMAALDAFTLFVTNADPKRANIGDAMKLLILWVVPAVALFSQAAILSAAVGGKMNMTRIVFVFIGLVFLVMGNYLPKTKQNYTAGIKLPWTLNSEENWNRTHRLAGRLYMLCGIVFIVMGMLGIMNLAVFLAAVIGSSAIPAVYSYLLYKKGV